MRVDIRNITTYQAGVAQASAYRTLTRMFSGMLKDHGLTSTQWFVLGTIYDCDSEGIQLTQLASRLQTGLPFITNTINLLESKRLVERRDSTTDSRSKRVYIRPEHVKLCEQIEQDLRAKMRQSIDEHISRDDLNTYVEVLYQLSRLR